MNERLGAYLARIGLKRAPSAGPQGLGEIVRAHRLSIPFENLDIRLGRGVKLDSESLHAKLVASRRGGYCFEQNGLLGEMLLALGIRNRPLLARVLLGPPGLLPARSHVLLLTEFGGNPWLADAGFGGSYVPPLPLIDGAQESTPDGVGHRLRRVGSPGSATGEWLLERSPGGGGEWEPQYSFDLAETTAADIEQVNHWTATRPNTRFTSLHIVSLALPEGIAALTETALTVAGPSGSETIDAETPETYRRALSEVFGICLSDDEVAALPLFAASS